MGKRPRITSKAYTDGAKGQSCVRCGADDGTVVSAHYSGMWANKIGKGAGLKADDFAVADLCERCHRHFDSYAAGRDAEAGLEFCMLIFATQRRRIEDGLLRLGRG